MAVTFSYHPDSPDELRVLLIKRNGKESSWGNTWEGAGGTPDKEDRTIIHSAARESKEETQIRPLRIAGKAFICSFYHKDRETGDIVLMRTLGFIVIDNEVTIKNGETIKTKRRWRNESGPARCNSQSAKVPSRSVISISIIAGSLRTKFAALLYT
ncbi:hypothetical protein CBS147333_10008 [Penicillium roqueforti]|nr:hypothetical protein CBS147333_10008 [Penicillium roqueforti]KAI3261178.1 hypothetical protein CBS147308_9972 [Penicillium roqueforti]KAI3277877.1 hypothetical protein DTO003C3_10012 [Penicillium roqueforti]KAI3300572.1 hypothetical protein DTO002I6_1295 [Penicillium roqueforti]